MIASMTKKFYRRTNLFEKILFVIGLIIIAVGFYFINKVYTGEGHLSWALLQAIFLWLVLLFLIILTDSNESVKEELREVIKEQSMEVKLLKKIAKEQLEEIKLLRVDLIKQIKK
jgi:surface polysaccharide O-acyltransferase-like enzyme